MGLKELRAELDDEVSTLLGSDFAIEVTTTQYVPHASDPAITFPDVLAKDQGAKLIETCVLYIDIRRSTELNFSHRPQTVARLYTAFVRAMTRVARHHYGHVRGIIGDRVMVIFDRADCFTNAVNCAIAMNTVAKYVINKRFKANEVECGIGIDAGNMLATKTGIRRHGVEQGNYRNLVWLGRPANIASKLTDLANKPAVTEQVQMVRVAYNQPVPPFSQALVQALLGTGGGPAPCPSQGEASPLVRALLGGAIGGLGALPVPDDPFGGVPPMKQAFGSGLSGLGALPVPDDPFKGGASTGEWRWRDETVGQFLSNVEVRYAPTRLVHTDPSFESFYLSNETRTIRAETPPILMTERVWRGFRAAQPNAPSVKSGWFRRLDVKTPGYSGAVFGGDVIFTDLKE